MKYAEIRNAFVDYFVSKNHQHVESSSLIPHNDPTLMFTNAGMNQFKDVFVGKDQRNYQRAVTVQKCLRAGGKHNDLENVGFTARHHTFFEMLGNFSFGDYFKREAIHMAWEFLTKVLNIPEERLYVTVFTTDDEAEEIWHKEIGVPKEKIFRFGEKDNFWRMGQTGPCGPCSEIFYDHHPEKPPVPIDQDEDRFVEIWNLVFMQFFEDESGKQTPLPKPSVDTGAGIERITAAMQGVSDNYQSDVFRPLLEKACQLSGRTYDWNALAKDREQIGSLKVVADHARAATFLISEGVLPSNEGRGYVLRRIMRRAVRYARKLSTDVSIYSEVCKEVIHTMGEFHPVLKEKSQEIIQTVIDEEKRFLQTLDRGSEILMREIQKAKKEKQTALSGETAFTLYDTYGFPVDLTQVIAREHQLDLSEEDFQIYLEKAKAKARRAQKTHKMTANEKHLADWTSELRHEGTTTFLGYDTLKTAARCLALSNGESEVQELSGPGFAIFDRTPFYAEGGGQAGDLGEINKQGKNFATIEDCKKMNDIFIHQIDAHQTLVVGEEYPLEVFAEERFATQANHSATHLLHAALKDILGTNVAQAGSLVNRDKLRFDFNHPRPVTPAELKLIEEWVNARVRLNLPVTARLQSHQEALDDGAVAMFGEKYGSTVRVIRMGHEQSLHSIELCGGTHVHNTSEVGLFKIVSESGVAAGVRRIEAVTGAVAFDYLNKVAEGYLKMAQSLNIARPDAWSTEDVDTFAGALSVEMDKRDEKLKSLEKELQKAKVASVSTESLLQEARSKKFQGQDVVALFTRVEIDDRQALSELVDQLRGQQSRLALFLIGESDAGAKPVIVAMGKDLKGLNAGQILREISPLLDGKGGGRPDFAQGSASNLDKLNVAQQKFYELFE